MTHPRDPEHDASTPPTPHGVVETLREELEEVVEHVPKPVRWTVGKLVLVGVLSLAAIVLLAAVSGVLYFTNRTELVAKEIVLLANQALARRSDVTVHVDDVKGNPLTGLRFIRPRVAFRDGEPWFDAAEIRASWALFALIRGDAAKVAIAIDEPVLRVTRGRDGRLRLPKWAANARPGRARVLDLDVRLRGGRVDAPKPLGRTEGIDATASIHTGDRTEVAIHDLHWREGPWGSKLSRLRGRYTVATDSVRFKLDELSASDLQLTARGAWSARGGEKFVHANVRRVAWRWLATVFDNGTFNVPGEGAVVIDARGDRVWNGAFRAALTWDSLAVEGEGRARWDGTNLALDALRGRSLAGDLNGDVRWSKQGWQVGGEARGANPAHWGALRLVGWPKGDLNGSFRYSVATGARTSSRLTAQLRDSEWTGWRVDSARVVVEFPAEAPDSFLVRGFRRGGTFTLDARVHDKGWGGPWTARDYPLDEWPDGRASGLRGSLASGAGRVESRAGALDVSGSLDGVQTDWSAAHVARWRASEVKGRLLPKPDLTARLELQDLMFVGIHFDSAAAPIHLGDQVVTFDVAQAFAGDTVVTATGHADWDGPQWSTLLNYASARSSQFQWTAEPPVRISGDPGGVITERLVADDGDAHLEAAGRWAAPGGFYDFEGRIARLDLARVGLPRDWGLEGRADVRLRVRGRSGDPEWTFDGTCARPGWGGHAADSVTLALSGRQHELTVRDALYQLDGGQMRLEGRVDRTPAPWPDSLTSTAVLRWLEDAGSWRGRATADAMPVDRLGRWAPAAEGWRGLLSGTLDVSGRPSAPEAVLELRGRGTGWRDYRMDDVQARAEYRPGLLRVPRAEMKRLNVLSSASGELPLQLALGRTPVLPEQPMSWKLELPEGDLQLVPLLVPQIQSARGRFDLRATIEGTPRRLDLSGSGHVRDGIIRPAGRQEVLEGVYADFHFDEDRVSLDSLQARQGRTGRVTGKGEVDLGGGKLRGYRFGLALRDFAASEDGFYAILFDGDFVVTQGPQVHGARLPQVVGDAWIKSGVVEFDFANQSEVQRIAASTQPLYWTYRIHAEATNNLRWRPPDGEIEFNADLDIEQSPDSLQIYGEMKAIRGTYFFLSNRFTLSQADLTFDNQQGVDPVMSIVASTRLKPLRGDLGTATGSDAVETITARITGRASQPVIDLTSSPSSWDQRAILGELTYGRFTNEAGQLSLTDPLDNYVTRQLNNQLSRELSGVFGQWLTDWEVQREQGGLFTGQGGYVVGFGAQVTPELQVRYKQYLPGSGAASTPASATSGLFERDLEAEYRINRFIYFTTELAQRRASAGVPQTGFGSADFNVNLKARWEY